MAWLIVSGVWGLVVVVLVWQLYRSRALLRAVQDRRAMRLVLETDGWWFDFNERLDRSVQIEARLIGQTGLQAAHSCQTPPPPGRHWRLRVDLLPTRELACKWEWDQSTFGD